MIDFDLEAMQENNRLDNLIDTPTGGSSGRWWYGADQYLVQYPADKVLPVWHPVYGESLGLMGHQGWINDCLHGRDMTNAVWTKTNMTASKDQTGWDGAANGACLLTTTGGNGSVTQSITDATAKARCFVIGIKLPALQPRPVTVELTTNGTTWVPVGATVSRHQFTHYVLSRDSATNPVVGVRVVESGASIIVDFAQCDQSRAFNMCFSPATTTAVTILPTQMLIASAGNLIKKSHSVVFDHFPIVGNRGNMTTGDFKNIMWLQYQVANANRLLIWSGSAGNNVEFRYTAGGSNNLVASHGLHDTWRREFYGWAAANADYRAYFNQARVLTGTVGTTWSSENSGSIELARHVPIGRLTIWPYAGTDT